MLIQKKKGLYIQETQVKHSSFISDGGVLVAPNPHRLHAMEFTRMKLLSN